MQRFHRLLELRLRVERARELLRGEREPPPRSAGLPFGHPALGDRLNSLGRRRQARS